MRKPKYLSPTAVALYKEDPEQYYLKYLVENRPDREPQTPAMAVGSAFDAYVKADLHSKLFGPGSNPAFEFDALFAAQVEKQNWDVAREAGAWCFEWYRRLGAIADLMLDLQKAIGSPRFEIDLRGVIHGEREGQPGSVIGVPLNGKPDCFYVSEDGMHVILDWKVNGYYSNSPPSPMPGYIRLREDGASFAAVHSKAKLETRGGVLINVAQTLDVLNVDWARQLTTYSCQTGSDVGSEFVARIEQLCCNKNKLVCGKPAIRVASHSLLVPAAYQHRVFQEYAELWDLLSQPTETFHFFRHLSLLDSQARCKALEGRAALLQQPATDKDAWFAKQFKKANSQF